MDFTPLVLLLIYAALGFFIWRLSGRLRWSTRIVFRIWLAIVLAMLLGLIISSSQSLYYDETVNFLKGPAHFDFERPFGFIVAWTSSRVFFYGAVFIMFPGWFLLLLALMVELLERDAEKKEAAAKGRGDDQIS